MTGVTIALDTSVSAGGRILIDQLHARDYGGGQEAA